MWILKDRLDKLEKRISALERKEQERIDKENHIKEHSSEALEEARRLLRLMK